LKQRLRSCLAGLKSFRFFRVNRFAVIAIQIRIPEMRGARVGP
jgi:hypothetical protein